VLHPEPALRRTAECDRKTQGHLRRHGALPTNKPCQTEHSIIACCAWRNDL
jgi:hypothetical protein